MGTSKLIASVVVVAAASVATADTVQMNFVGTGSGRNVRIYTDSGARNVFAGQLIHNFSGGTGSLTSLTGNRFTYCVDINQFVSGSSRTYDLMPIESMTLLNPMGADRAQAITDIFNAQPFWPTQASVSSDYAAALQLVIWDIITDYSSSSGLSSLSLTSGTFRATQMGGGALGLGVVSHYNTFVGYIGSSASAGIGMLGFGNSSYQDQVTPTSIPAPGAGLLAGLGGLALARRRR